MRGGVHREPSGGPSGVDWQCDVDCQCGGAIVARLSCQNAVLSSPRPQVEFPTPPGRPLWSPPAAEEGGYWGSVQREARWVKRSGGGGGECRRHRSHHCPLPSPAPRPVGQVDPGRSPSPWCPQGRPRGVPEVPWGSARRGATRGRRSGRGGGVCRKHLPHHCPLPSPAQRPAGDPGRSPGP